MVAENLNAYYNASFQGEAPGRGFRVDVEQFHNGEWTFWRTEFFQTKKDALWYVDLINVGSSHENAIRKITARVRNRERARARSEAMRSVGMKRNRDGSWE